jgi:hypothetical protein
MSESSHVAALLRDGPRAISLGIDQLREALEASDRPVTQVDWRPPASASLAEALDRLQSPTLAARIERANGQVLARLMGARPFLIDVRPGREAIPELRDKVLLHAGPPMTWDEMTGPMRGAAIGAALFEGWATDERAATDQLGRGTIRLLPCHDASAVGPMGGITSGSMPVLVVGERTWGGRAYCNLNEGIGRVMRFGAYGPEVLERLAWQRDVLGPALGQALRNSDGVDLHAIMARALSMGDEMHQRNVAASLLLSRDLAPLLAGMDMPSANRVAIAGFMGRTEQFFLNVAMAACKSIADAAKADAVDSSLVTTMSRNGVRFGIKLGATGERWYTAPVNTPDGLYFSGYTSADANPDIGDSAITETVGIGAFCMAAAPAVLAYVGAGRFADGVRITREMQEITAGENPDFALPTLDSRGAPTGIDVRRVVETGIEPIINTGIAHRQAGVGQVGAGTVRAPLACFEQALLALDARLARAP